MGNNLNFQDIIKKSILNIDMSQKISPVNVFICLLMTLAVALFIFFIYKLTFRGVAYSYTFNVSLIPMCLITALIILTISSNVVLSLGMVGALSIVRFRTAIKDPMDIVFMFWSISVGIASGAGIYTVSVIGSLFIGVTIFFATRYKYKGKRFILIIHYKDEANDEVKKTLAKLKYDIKSKTITPNSIELTVEVKIKGDNTALVNRFSKIPGVIDASLVSYNGDYAA